MQKHFSLFQMGVSGDEEALGLIARLLPASSAVVGEKTLLIWEEGQHTSSRV